MTHDNTIHDNSPSRQSTLIEAALAYVAAGRSVAPISPNQKYPQGNAWKVFQSRLATPKEIQSWFRGSPVLGLCIICGNVSGGLEGIDFDEYETYNAYVALVTELGYKDLLQRLIIEQTPRPGNHLGYCCEVITGNTKLAQVKIGVRPNGKDEIKTLIETRGEGGLIVCYPTPPGIHPEHPEHGYELIQGDWTQPPLISPEEREILWNCARALNRYTPEARSQSYREPRSDEDRVGNDYNTRVSVDDLLKLLEGEGWEKTYSQGDGHYLRRPGKDRGCWSATLNVCGPKRFYVFSTNADPFDNDRSYDPFGIYLRLKHQGDAKAAAKALAEQGYGRNGQSSGHVGAAQGQEQHTSGVRDSSDTLEPIPLATVHAKFQTYFYLPDTGVIDVCFATYVANWLPGDPTWAQIIGPPSGGKTEPAMAMRLLPQVRIVSSMTEAALLSGTASKERSKDAKGGLLREIGKFGILICKDFTSILSMRYEQRTVLLGHLRDIYDGHMDRKVGTDGGRSLLWEGRLGFLSVCTDAIDSHHTVMAAMGHRFLFYRLPESTKTDRQAQARIALKARGREGAIRDELSACVRDFFASIKIPQTLPELPESDEDFLVTLADFTTQCRSAVERDGYRREIELIHGAELPARLVKALAHLHEGFRVIGVSASRARQLLAKIALDSIPKVRLLLIEKLAAARVDMLTKDLASSIGYPTTTTLRALEDLMAQHVVERSGGKSNAHLWRIKDEIRTDYWIIKSFSEKSQEPES